uniref:BED-type domain-containing protein n=1 Tax=Populus alba TaxID=43335 RepID=A0A4U5PZC1_POPAL|nr:hypothetical protein D5086_0000162960 [Populus alba]
MDSQHGSTSNSTPSTTQSSKPSISISTSSGIRGKIDLAWGHCREAPELSVRCQKTKLVCLYCAKVFASGGINRFKQHLVGSKGEVEQCCKCPPDVRHQMLLNFQGNVEKKRRAREMEADFNPYSAKQRGHEERMIRQLEDDCEGEKDGAAGATAGETVGGGELVLLLAGEGIDCLVRVRRPVAADETRGEEGERRSRRPAKGESDGGWRCGDDGDGSMVEELGCCCCFTGGGRVEGKEPREKMDDGGKREAGSLWETRNWFGRRAEVVSVAPLCEGCCRRKTTLLYGEGSLLLVEGAGSAGSLDGATAETPLVRPNDGRLETMEIVAEREKPVGAEERWLRWVLGFIFFSSALSGRSGGCSVDVEVVARWPVEGSGEGGPFTVAEREDRRCWFEGRRLGCGRRKEKESCGGEAERAGKKKNRREL